MFAYLLCHLVGVTSTVTNPVLYAMLNCNFQKEFQNAAGKITGLFVCSLTSHGREDSRSADLQEVHEDIQLTGVTTTTKYFNNITQEISTSDDLNSDKLTALAPALGANSSTATGSSSRLLQMVETDNEHKIALRVNNEEEDVLVHDTEEWNAMKNMLCSNMKTMTERENTDEEISSWNKSKESN